MSTNHKVPFIDLKRTSTKIGKNFFQQWNDIVESSGFIEGPFIAKLEDRLAEVLKVPFAVTCANGTDAIAIALKAKGLGSGMKVALPNLTFWATYEAIVHVGASPVLIDIDLDDLQMSLDEFKCAWDKFHFDAAILVHLYGWTSKKLEEFREFCQEKKIVLIEDGAQAFGVEVFNKDSSYESVFHCSDIATLSFYPSKVLGGCMDGGAIVVQDPKTAELCKALRNHGRATHYSYSEIGWNSRMSSLNAAYLIAALDVSSELLNERKKVETFYHQELGSLQNLTIYKSPTNIRGNGYLTVLCANSMNGEEISLRLKEKGINVGRVYPQTIGAQAPAKNALRYGSLSISENFTKKVFNLPLFPGITKEEMLTVVKNLKKILL